MANQIMTSVAQAVTKHEMVKNDIAQRYDALQRLGLVAPGGYAKYFETARKVLVTAQM
jgi:histidinol dehydrogenase